MVLKNSEPDFNLLRLSASTGRTNLIQITCSNSPSAITLLTHANRPNCKLKHASKTRRTHLTPIGHAPLETMPVLPPQGHRPQGDGEAQRRPHAGLQEEQAPRDDEQGAGGGEEGPQLPDGVAPEGNRQRAARAG